MCWSIYDFFLYFIFSADADILAVLQTTYEGKQNSKKNVSFAEYQNNPQLLSAKKLETKGS